MNSHIDVRRLQEAAKLKIRLDSSEWKHMEECRQCVNELAKALCAYGGLEAQAAA
jgi:hypothetical protein